MLHKASLTPVVNSVISLTGVTECRQQSETNKHMASRPARHAELVWAVDSRLQKLAFPTRFAVEPKAEAVAPTPLCTSRSSLNTGHIQKVETCAKLCITWKIPTLENGQV